MSKDTKDTLVKLAFVIVLLFVYVGVYQVLTAIFGE